MKLNQKNKEDLNKAKKSCCKKFSDFADRCTETIFSK